MRRWQKPALGFSIFSKRCIIRSGCIRRLAMYRQVTSSNYLVTQRMLNFLSHSGVHFRPFGCFVLLLTGVISLYGKTTNPASQVSGIVLDATGAVISDAKVILRREVG